MTTLEDYRAAILLDEPATIEPAPDWHDRLPAVLARLGISSPAGATPDQLLDLLRGVLAPREPNSLGSDLTEEIEAVAAGASASLPVTDPLALASLTDTRYPARDRVALFVGDITTLGVDAIVNAANTAMLGCRIPNHPCIDSAIHSAAGPRLRDDCATIMEIQAGGESVGGAKITRGYALPAKYVIHTVGPQLASGANPTSAEREQLASCYRSCLDVAAEVDDIFTVGFCGISTGVFSFPREDAAPIALRTLADWVEASPDRFNRLVIDCYSPADATFYSETLREWP